MEIPNSAIQGAGVLLAVLLSGGSYYTSTSASTDKFTGAQAKPMRADIAENRTDIKIIESAVGRIERHLSTISANVEWLTKYSKTGQAHIGTRTYEGQAKVGQ